MKEIIKDYLGQAKVGRKQSYKNLAVFPLLSPYVAGAEYILLDEALTEGVIEIVEVDESGLASKQDRLEQEIEDLRSEFENLRKTNKYGKE